MNTTKISTKIIIFDLDWAHPPFHIALNPDRVKHLLTNSIIVAKLPLNVSRRGQGLFISVHYPNQTVVSRIIVPVALYLSLRQHQIYVVTAHCDKSVFMLLWHNLKSFHTRPTHLVHPAPPPGKDIIGTGVSINWRLNSLNSSYCPFTVTVLLTTSRLTPVVPSSFRCIDCIADALPFTILTDLRCTRPRHLKRRLADSRQNTA